ncbi:hypothetical protein HYFRA_00001927 [Hymenoscyphus fraxineus]|uniref:FAD-binding PCMH-type domain-containing protein n=1 Tax=Hymenoscyphus fraxineus TaxID=746836 RepID=A0A9N9KKB5_9HELO|nr:hypothetical protein HYFRA_00001927 [Hymenoscyphus fraxineus]
MRSSIVVVVGSIIGVCLADVIATNPSHISVAAENVTVPANATFFDYETVQLTNDSLLGLNADTLALFGFNDEGASLNLTARSTSSCRVYPGDLLWPNTIIWTQFDVLLGGALIKTVPLAAPCYNGPHFDPVKCADLTADWQNSNIHAADPTSMMSPVYQGLTCQVTADPTQNCTLGAFPYYAVNAKFVAQIQLAVNFARAANLRLVVKNTGHDFSGKSGGAGALSIWTHNLKDIKYFKQYKARGSSYNGPAFKAGAGVQGFEIYKAAHDRGLMVVGGEGETVGITGGYIAGGGHSPLSSLHGMGADQVLSMEVVTADGRFVTADFEHNTDLFWALRGGGGSTYGVVTSVTIKAYQDLPVFTASTFNFTVGVNGVTAENFWAGFRKYLDYFPSLSKQGIYAYWFILNTATGPMFLMQPFWASGKSLNETNALLAPWFAQLNELNISFTPKTVEYSNFYDGWKSSFPREVVQKTHVATGSRLWPTEMWSDATSLDRMYNAIKTSSQSALTIIGFIINPSLENGGNPDNSVNPAWRNTYSHVLQSASWVDGDSPEIQSAVRQNFTHGHMQRWRDASPGAGSYLGESDIMEPDFGQSFWGDKYPRLLSLKEKLDPRDVFFAQTAVGSEDWEVVTANGLPSGNGKLCRV